MGFNPIRYVVRGLLGAIAGERGIKWLDRLVAFGTGVPVNDESEATDYPGDDKPEDERT